MFNLSERTNYFHLKESPDVLSINYQPHLAYSLKSAET